MKKIHKIISVILTAVLLVSAFSVLAGAEPEAAAPDEKKGRRTVCFCSRSRRLGAV